MTESLYSLSTQLARVQDMIISEEGVIEPELERILDDLLPQVQEKCGNIGKWMKNIEGNVEAIDSEIKRLQRRKEIAENLYGRLKDYVKTSMERVGIAKIDTGLFPFSIQKSPPSVEIVDAEAIGAEYKTVKTEVVINKKQILEELKSGVLVKGAELKQGTHLRMR